jgi:hypothetical protein
LFGPWFQLSYVVASLKTGQILLKFCLRPTAEDLIIT